MAFSRRWRIRDTSCAKSEPGQLEVDNLLYAHRYELILSSQLQQLTIQRQKIGTEIERRRQALIEADRELRILEKLRERHAREFRQADEQSEMRQMDEIALRRTHLMREGDES